MNAVDQKKGVYLILFDLSAAFDTVGHDILLDFLRDHIGLDCSVLDIFRSYLSGRTQCVSVAGVLSELSELMFGVPQGMVLGNRILHLHHTPCCYNATLENRISYLC